MTRSLIPGTALFGACAAFLVGCASDGLEAGRDGVSAPPAHERSYQECRDGYDGDGDGRTDCADSDCERWPQCDFTGTGDAACVFLRRVAQRTSDPVDLVFAVDSSGSMIKIADTVGEQLAQLADGLLDSTVDFRVVLLTASWMEKVPEDLRTDPRYRFVAEHINRRDAFDALLNRFPDYQDILRPDALTAVTVVSDDDSDMDADEFEHRYAMKLGHEFVFHAVASEDATHGAADLLPGCTGPFGAAWNVGVEYYDLAEQTGGETFSICTDDWAGLFDDLERHTVRTVSIPCGYDLPMAPDHHSIDPEEVNVLLYGESAEPEPLPRAYTKAQCQKGGAWYYDNNMIPTRVTLCPQMCAAVEGDAKAQLDISLGCKTEVTVL
ncbi:MAG: hypothetical protein KC416_01830 [Myxococcales bacterium]|nr:hypothetical protein [Myxococcales bacterium]